MDGLTDGRTCGGKLSSETYPDQSRVAISTMPVILQGPLTATLTTGMHYSIPGTKYDAGRSERVDRITHTQ